MNILKCIYKTYFRYKKVMPTINILTCYFISIIANDITLQGSWHFFYNEIKAPIDVEAVRKFPLTRSSRKDQNTPLGNSRPQDWRFPGTPIIIWGCLSWHPGEEAERGWFSVLTDRLGHVISFLLHMSLPTMQLV